MSTLEEKRVYGDAEAPTPVFLATELGVVVARVSGDTVGEFAVEFRCRARDVAAGHDGDGNGVDLAVATDDDVFVGADHGESRFGPAVAVGLHDGDVLAAAESGRVGRFEGDTWETLGEVADPRAIDGPLVAAADGVHRVVDGGLRGAGLSDVRDVAGRGVPRAATAGGLYSLGNGWLDEVGEPCRVVDAAPESPVDAHARPRVHATFDDGRVLELADDGRWTNADLGVPDGAGDVVGFAYGPEVTVAATREGTLLVRGPGEGDDPEGGGRGAWRSRALGVGGVGGVAIP